MIHIPPALKHRRFRYLWLGLLISMAGSQMQLWAIVLAHPHPDRPAHRPGRCGTGAHPTGDHLLADRRSHRGYAQPAADHAGHPDQPGLAGAGARLADPAGEINLVWIYAITALQAVAAAFDLPARQALVPNLVPARDLPNAFSLNSIAAHTGAIIGPALSGWVIAGLGQSYVYLINAVSFLAVILALLLMGPVAAGKPCPDADCRG